jgi:hypothetical protein
LPLTSNVLKSAHIRVGARREEPWETGSRGDSLALFEDSAIGRFDEPVCGGNGRPGMDGWNFFGGSEGGAMARAGRISESPNLRILESPNPRISQSSVPRILTCTLQSPSKWLCELWRRGDCVIMPATLIGNFFESAWLSGTGADGGIQQW